MIRILQLPGSLSRNNGRMTVVMNIYRRINREKIQFDFAGTNDEGNDNEYIDEIKSMGGHVYPLEQGGVFAARRLVKSIFKSYPYKAVHYHQLSEFGLTFDLLKKYGVRQLIVHSHATVLSENRWKVPRNRIFSLPIYFYSNQNIAVSNEAGQNLFLSNNFKFIPNAIDQSKFSFNEEIRCKVRQKLTVQDEDVLVGHVGRFAKQKNQSFLIPVMTNIIAKNAHFHFLFIGDGPEKEGFRQAIQQAGLTDNVIILDSTPEIKNYYSAMDLFVLLSLFEGLPMAGIEAQANGLPIIVSDTISHQLEITKATFLSVQPDKESIKSWVEAIRIPQSRIDNQNVQEQFLKKGFLIDSSVAKWEEIYLS